MNQAANPAQHKEEGIFDQFLNQTDTAFFPEQPQYTVDITIIIRIFNIVVHKLLL